MAQTNEIFAGAALVGVSSTPLTNLSAVASVVASSPYAGNTHYIEVADASPVSGLVSYNSAQSILGIVRRTGEILVCHAVESDTLYVTKGLGIHPKYNQKAYIDGTMALAIEDLDNIDFYQYFIMPNSLDYIETNEALVYEETQATFRTKDNSDEYDTISSAVPECKLTFKFPRGILAHPIAKGLFFPDDRIHSDGETDPSYFSSLGGITAGEKLTGQIIIILRKEHLGTTYDKTAGTSSKTVQAHDRALWLFRCMFTPTKKNNFDIGSQAELELEGYACAVTFNDMNNRSVNVGRGFENFTPQMHQLLYPL